LDDGSRIGIKRRDGIFGRRQLKDATIASMMVNATSQYLMKDQLLGTEPARGKN
jgi:hypothetical protein